MLIEFNKFKIDGLVKQVVTYHMTLQTKNKPFLPPPFPITTHQIPAPETLAPAPSHQPQSPTSPQQSPPSKPLNPNHQTLSISILSH